MARPPRRRSKPRHGQIGALISLKCFLCLLANSIEPVEDKEGRLHFICEHCKTKNKLRRNERGEPPYVVTGIETDPKS